MKRLQVGKGTWPRSAGARRHGARLSRAALTPFLKKLDEIGILAGERSLVTSVTGQSLNGLYIRFKLFDPDRLFSIIVRRLRWVWTPGFLAATLLGMLAALFLALADSEEMTLMPATP